jgi:hypothetical protein
MHLNNTVTKTSFFINEYLQIDYHFGILHKLQTTILSRDREYDDEAIQTFHLFYHVHMYTTYASIIIYDNWNTKVEKSS